MHIVVYAGPIKTASTTLQTAMGHNRDVLRRAGIEFFGPDAPDGWAEWSLVALFLGPFVLETLSLFATPEEHRSWSADAWQDFEAQLDRSTAEVALISSEHFYHVRDKAGLVARLRQRADRVSFVAYARDPVSLFVSATDAAARGGDAYREIDKPDRYRYPIQLMRGYEALVGEGDLVIRSFDPQAMVGGDIVADFFHVLSELTGRKVIPEVAVARENKSIGGASTLWLLSANALGPFEGEAAERLAALVGVLQQDPAVKRLPKLRMTDPEIDKAIRVRNREIIDWLNAGPLADAPLETAPPDAEVLPADRLEERMRRWLLSYGREEDMRVVMEAVLRAGAPNAG